MGRAEVSPLVFFHPCTLSTICGTISKILTLRVKREFCVLVVHCEERPAARDKHFAGY